MTAPTLTADGFMHWPPRDWVESLCTPLPDGTWLVQAPLAGGEKPLLYILRDTATKDQFLFRAVGLIRLRTAWRAVATLRPHANMFIIFMAIPLARPALYAVLLFLVLGGLAHLVWLNYVFRWLGERALQPPPGSKRPATLVRTAEEWEALYLSNGLRAERLAGLLGIAAAASVIILAVLSHLTICQGVGVLDPLYEGMAGWERRWLETRCDVDGLTILAGIGSIAYAVFLMRFSARQRRKGRAVPLAGPTTG